MVTLSIARLQAAVLLEVRHRLVQLWLADRIEVSHVRRRGLLPGRVGIIGMRSACCACGLTPDQASRSLRIG